MNTNNLIYNFGELTDCSRSTHRPQVRNSALNHVIVTYQYVSQPSSDSQRGP